MVTAQTLVATANVHFALGPDEAREAVEAVTATEPDLLGLQEWGWSRRSLLPRVEYAWVTPAYGGNPVGARRDRFELIGCGFSGGWPAQTAGLDLCRFCRRGWSRWPCSVIGSTAGR